MRGIYSYIRRAYSVATIPYFYVSTSCSMFGVPNMAVFYSSLISCFPSMLLKYLLNDSRWFQLLLLLLVSHLFLFLLYYYYYLGGWGYQPHTPTPILQNQSTSLYQPTCNLRSMAGSTSRLATTSVTFKFDDASMYRQKRGTIEGW